MKRFILFLATTLISIEIFSQSSFLPQNLGENVNSGYSEINPILAPDGKTLYFVRVNHPENNYGFTNSQDIWFSRMNTNGTWSEAERLPDSVNIGRYNAILSLSDDGKTALIKGIYNKNGTMWKKKGLSIIHKTSHGWTKPEPLNITGFSSMNSGLNTNAYLSRDEKILILSFSKAINSGKQDLYVSLVDENKVWSKPKKIKALNTRFIETSPFLSFDNKVLYFSSNRRSENNFDIYKAERLDEGWEKWSLPEILNDTINTLRWESYYKTNLSGSTAFYSSTNESFGQADIFRIKLFEEKPFIVVSGKIINSKTKKPLPPNQDFSVLANGTAIDSLIINHDNSSFTAVMPLGNSYSLRANVDKFEPENKIIDAKDLKEYTEIYEDLMVKPFDYVTLKGSLLVKSTNEIIPTSSNPKVYVNGDVVDSMYVDYDAGIYEIDLPFGSTYTLVVNTNEYDAIPETLNLTNVDEYREINRNLYVDIEKTAIITGRIYDKKSNKPFPADVPLMVHINETESNKVVIDSISRVYSVEVSLGAVHSISAVAENYYPVVETVDLANEDEKIKVYKDLYLVPVEVGQSVRLNNIFFETGKSSLKEESYPELFRVVKFLNDNPSIKIEIGGHTDNVGKAAYNMKLSTERAKAVAEFIMLQGIPESAITSKGYGLTKPIADNNTAEGRQINRRVEFTIIGK